MTDKQQPLIEQLSEVSNETNISSPQMIPSIPSNGFTINNPYLYNYTPPGQRFPVMNQFPFYPFLPQFNNGFDGSNVPGSQFFDLTNSTSIKKRKIEDKENISDDKKKKRKKNNKKETKKTLGSKGTSYEREEVEFFLYNLLRNTEMCDIADEYFAKFESKDPRTASSIQTKYKEVRDDMITKCSKDNSLLTQLIETESNFKKLIEMMTPVTILLEGQDVLIFPMIRVGFKQWKANHESLIQDIHLKQIFDYKSDFKIPVVPGTKPMEELIIAVEFPCMIPRFTESLTPSMDALGIRGIILTQEIVPIQNEMI